MASSAFSRPYGNVGGSGLSRPVPAGPPTATFNDKHNQERMTSNQLAELNEEQREEINKTFYATHGVPATSLKPSPGGTSTKPSAICPLLLPLSTFQALMASRILARDPEEEILRAFHLFDEDGKGKITLADLRGVARELREGLQEEELVAMIEEFEMDGDGAISREEFVGICFRG
ncbi:MAG: hypothetical protein Q9169_008575 [Polycauliona sp. 2 TL-2023]